MKIRSIIVDDEPAAREILEGYLSKLPEFENLGSFSNALDANSFLLHNTIDVIFIDIKMPELNGMDFIKSLSPAPLVVFSTAFAEYAVEGFLVDAVDYLLKPYSFERFLQATNKVLGKLNIKNPPPAPFLFLHANKKIHRVEPQNILFIESKGDYVRFHTIDGSLLVLGTMISHANELEKCGFMRIHKSYCINLDKINYIEGNHVRIESETIPIGATYKEKLLNYTANKK
jgi:DNA-binding LytR/AlgR family response regulator